MPDASYRNNADKSSQRAHVIFIAEDRKIGRQGLERWLHRVHTRGSVVDYESHKITTTTQSTTVAELNALNEVFWNLSVSFVLYGLMLLVRSFRYIFELMPIILLLRHRPLTYQNKRKPIILSRC